ncbi:hypothetical protein Clacol_009687 [Clathrus columnatus]|uniref:Uncharacterized protein n=1 Tax=Clathrus columnatus TaxID=1419009 RepID=A0AAV5ASU4_9AGAM|nr:hypothetical protein Clacol_009687 [Clathrus columnatus]
MPWYNGEEATKYLREVLKDHYVYSDALVFKTLWETYNSCQFVEDEGDIVFYKNKRGEAVCQPAMSY